MADLDLPRGPLVQHLRAMHALASNLAKATTTATGADVDQSVIAHAHHVQAIAAYTADKPRGVPTPPRPEPIQPGEERRDGWDFLVCGPDGTVLAGWTSEGQFFAWSPTEVITNTLLQAIMGLQGIVREAEAALATFTAEVDDRG